jgi:hypothetical protein
MALTSVQIIEIRYPALFAQTSIMDGLILDAEEELDEAVYCDKYARAVALLAMHNYLKDKGAGAAGAITSETEGRLSRSFGGGASDNDWMSTRWGKELYELTLQCLGGAYTNRMM